MSPRIQTIRTAQLAAQSFGTPNYRFNRVETPNAHLYVNDFGPSFLPETTYKGWAKVRLLHARDLSIFSVDQLYLPDYRNDGLVWFQPFFFTANQLVKDGTEITTTIYVDLSWGHRYELRFMNSGFVRRYDDGSQLFRCTLRGPRHLMRLSSGTARWYANRRIALKVFHHTTALAASQIKASRLRASSRNILGDRYTSNYGYAYVTALDRISTVEDLAMIAMADAGIVTYRLDPKPTGGENIVASSIYNQGVADRAAAVSLEVDAAHLVPPYLWRHYGCPTYYEVFQPFNYRIALQPGAELPLQPEQVSPDILKPHGFALVGRTDDPMKILAPLRERDAEVLKVELGDETDLCTFWFEHANTNLYDDKVIELQAFEDTVP